MKYRLKVIIFLLSMTVTAVFGSDYQVCFTPAQRCGPMILDTLYGAKHSIYMQAYSFTARSIAKALIKAQRRGVTVKVIVDKSELLNYSKLWQLLSAKVPVWLDNKVSIAHNKVMIIDNRTVITGSYNFTNAAEYKNAENVLRIHDTDLAIRYLKNWQSRQQQSIRLNYRLAKKYQKRLLVQQNDQK